MTTRIKEDINKKHLDEPFWRRQIEILCHNCMLRWWLSEIFLSISHLAIFLTTIYEVCDANQFWQVVQGKVAFYCLRRACRLQQQLCRSVQGIKFVAHDITEVNLDSIFAVLPAAMRTVAQYCWKGGQTVQFHYTTFSCTVCPSIRIKWTSTYWWVPCIDSIWWWGQQLIKFKDMAIDRLENLDYFCCVILCVHEESTRTLVKTTTTEAYDNLQARESTEATML